LLEASTEVYLIVNSEKNKNMELSRHKTAGKIHNIDLYLIL